MSEYIIKRKVPCEGTLGTDCFHGYVRQSLNDEQVKVIESGAIFIPFTNDMMQCGHCNGRGHTTDEVTMNEFFRDAEIQYRIQQMLRPIK